MPAIYTADIKSDMPTSDQALRRVDMALAMGRMSGAAAVKLIHGYGSTGQGGAIRTRARRYLGELKSKGKIKAFLPGEEFTIFNADTRSALQACPALRQDRDLDRQNNGITIILL
ncbi:MAG: Smr/MutS family protein [Oscillospiraceae bacterium]|jgi:hypothetical protein|nr:Smr/MutS family protein [Oscillospiraceae bacterium]